MAELELNLQKDVDRLVKMVVPKIQSATAKKTTSKFLTDSLNGLQVKLSLADAEQLHKAVKEMTTKRKVEAKKKEAEEKARKAKEEEEEKAAKAAANNEVTDADFFKDFM